MTSLLTRYQRLLEQQEIKDFVAATALDLPEDAVEKHELLQSVHDWMEEERMNALVRKLRTVLALIHCCSDLV